MEFELDSVHVGIYSGRVVTLTDTSPNAVHLRYEDGTTAWSYDKWFRANYVPYEDEV